MNTKRLDSKKNHKGVKLSSKSFVTPTVSQNTRGFTNGMALETQYRYGGRVTSTNRHSRKIFGLSVIILALLLSSYIIVSLPVISRDIVVDGDFHDWKGRPMYHDYGDTKDGTIDIVSTSWHQDDTGLYFYVETRDNILTGTPVDGGEAMDAVSILVDWDDDASTGFNYAGFGYDYLLRIEGASNRVAKSEVYQWRGGWVESGIYSSAVSSGKRLEAVMDISPRYDDLHYTVISDSYSGLEDIMEALPYERSLYIGEHPLSEGTIITPGEFIPALELNLYSSHETASISKIYLSGLGEEKGCVGNMKIRIGEKDSSGEFQQRSEGLYSFTPDEPITVGGGEMKTLTISVSIDPDWTKAGSFGLSLYTPHPVFLEGRDWLVTTSESYSGPLSPTLWINAREAGINIDGNFNDWMDRAVESSGWIAERGMAWINGTTYFYFRTNGPLFTPPAITMGSGILGSSTVKNKIGSDRDADGRLDMDGDGIEDGFGTSDTDGDNDGIPDTLEEENNPVQENEDKGLISIIRSAMDEGYDVTVFYVDTDGSANSGMRVSGDFGSDAAVVITGERGQVHSAEAYLTPSETPIKLYTAVKTAVGLDALEGSLRALTPLTSSRYVLTYYHATGKRDTTESTSIEMSLTRWLPYREGTLVNSSAGFNITAKPILTRIEASWNGLDMQVKAINGTLEYNAGEGWNTLEINATAKGLAGGWSNGLFILGVKALAGRTPTSYVLYYSPATGWSSPHRVKGVNPVFTSSSTGVITTVEKRPEERRVYATYMKNGEWETAVEDTDITAVMAASLVDNGSISTFLYGGMYDPSSGSLDDQGLYYKDGNGDLWHITYLDGPVRAMTAGEAADGSVLTYLVETELTIETRALMAFRSPGTFTYPIVVDRENKTISPVTDRAPKSRAVKEWTFMVYIDADNSLNGYDDGDINEMETVGSTSDMNVIVLRDGSTNGDTKAYYIQQDSDPSTITSPQIPLTDINASWGNELNMGDGQVVVDFINFCFNNYPAKKYIIDFWNHGGSWLGQAWDDSSNDHLTIRETGMAFDELRNLTGKTQVVDVVSFDECLMSSSAVIYEFKKYANYTVSSEDSEGGNGWPYDTIFQKVANDPLCDASTMSYYIWLSYMDEYDPDRNGGDLATMAVMNNELYDYYMAPALNSMAQKMRHKAGTLNSQITTARDNSRAWQASAGYDFDRDYRDFALNIMAQIPSSTDADIYNAANTVASLNSTTTPIVEHHGYNTGENGFKVYVENGASYNTDYGPLMIARETNWDDFVKAMLSSTDVPNVEPNIAILSPADGTTVDAASVTISGTADDSGDGGTVDRVEVKVDRESWAIAEGTTSWSMDIRAADYGLGTHRIFARSYDGTDYSDSWPYVDITFTHHRDAGVSDMRYPEVVTSGSSVGIEADVRNYGDQDLNENIDVRLVITDGSGTEVYNNVQTLSALAAGQTTTLSWSYTPPSTGKYTVTVRAELSGEGFPSNDEMKGNLFVADRMNLVQRIDGYGGGERFGYNVTALGDLNNDGYSDFAVSAPGSPYEKPITVDGNPSDWTGTPSATVHDAVISEHEWIYTGAADDRRTDAGMTDDNDLTEMRITFDARYMYMMFRFKDLVQANAFHVALSIDTDGDGTGLDWIGDNTIPDDSGIPLAIKSDTNLEIHATTLDSPDIEVFRYGDSAWHSPSSGDYSIWLDDTYDCVEVRVRLEDVGITLGSTIKVSGITCQNSMDAQSRSWANDWDTTGDFGTLDAIDCLGDDADSQPDVNAWDRDLSDGYIDNYYTIDTSQWVGMGCVALFHGSPTMSGTVSRSGSDKTIYGTQAGERLGSDIAAGDMDGDGLMDLFIGAPSHNSGSGGEGAVYIFRGSDLASAGQHLDTGSAFAVIEGTQGGARLGMSLSAGDINNNGRDDLIVSAPYSQDYYGSTTGAGMAYIFFDTTLAAGGNIPLSSADVVITGAEAGEHCGASLSAGDINGDGIDDCVIGAPGRDIVAAIYGSASLSSLYATGRMNVFTDDFETDKGWTLNNMVRGTPQGGTFTPSEDHTPDGMQALAKYLSDDGGTDGDATSPVIDISGTVSPRITFWEWYDLNAGDTATIEVYDGAAWVEIERLPESTDSSGNWIQKDYDLSAYKNANFQIRVTVTDAKASTYHNYLMDDLVIYDAGVSTPDLRISGAPSSDFGFSVSAAGDLDGDGSGDLLIGAPRNGTGGSAYIFFGSASLSGDKTYTDADAVLLSPGGENERFGYFVEPAGDLNGDGSNDVAIGAPDNNDNGQGCGAVYIFTGPVSSAVCDTPYFVYFGSADDHLGQSGILAGDVNGDGHVEIVTGAPRAPASMAGYALVLNVPELNTLVLAVLTAVVVIWRRRYMSAR